ncbi:glycosyltransferase [Flexilinea flocculi]|uniref:Glycosyltransferase n=1 Tax=Flexilinea flocculi TaxID=1678840 RepID=A0A0K8PBE7_9CHLR|nr:glycosyltransferase [Flexilinea flocculi]NMB94541.1 glycosyltransferase [Flexilinea flocculi]GAP39839.1 glycosyltransferase [Flexilinea flocculi]
MIKQRKIAFFSYDMRVGGAEKMILTLLPWFINAGYSIDLVLVKKTGAFLTDIDPRVNLISLKKEHVSQSLFPLIRYFKKSKPDVFISNLTHLNIVTIIAKIFSGTCSKIIITEHNTITANNLENGGKESILVFLSKFLYPLADKTVVVSEGAAQNLIDAIRINPNKVQNIYNPIDIDHIHLLAKEQINESWLTEKSIPVLIAVGRLEQQKNFSFLMDVFQTLIKKRKARLLILGEGSERQMLEQQMIAYGIENEVKLPGIKTNPYPYISNADILVCTSKYEGFNITLAESLACGTPVISMNCPYGPAEILDNGTYGQLIPPGDRDGMVDAIIAAIDHPESLPSKEKLMERAKRFSAEKIFSEYQELFLKEFFKD